MRSIKGFIINAEGVDTSRTIKDRHS